MSWLKIDDGMGSHKKTRRLIKKGTNSAGLAAFGLHALALLHASEYLTDGFVEAEFVAETLDDARVRGKNRALLVELLVAGGQWEEVEGGWNIHDYLDHNPSKTEVQARRQKESERKARGRRTESARTDAGIQAESDGPVPSRPVPSRPDPTESDARAARSDVVVALERTRLTFNRKPLPDTVRLVAEEILRDFNRQAGTAFRSLTDTGKLTADFSRIVGAIVDDERITAAVGAKMVSAALAAPWWKDGKPTPSVVFGENVRGKYVEAALGANTDGGRTAAEYVTLRNNGAA